MLPHYPPSNNPVSAKNLKNVLFNGALAHLPQQSTICWRKSIHPSLRQGWIVGWRVFAEVPLLVVIMTRLLDSWLISPRNVVARMVAPHPLSMMPRSFGITWKYHQFITLLSDIFKPKQACVCYELCTQESLSTSIHRWTAPSTHQPSTPAIEATGKWNTKMRRGKATLQLHGL